MKTRGEVVLFECAGPSLACNPLHDPETRRFPVWLPPDYSTASARRFPVVYVLAGYSGHGRQMIAEKTFGESLDQRLDRLHAAGVLSSMIVVMPDCFTRLGGSQYLDSSATGLYESYLMRDVIPAIDKAFHTLPEHRGVLGKSSGGFGALRLGLRHPRVFPVVASISGDALFEYCYLPDFAGLVSALDPFEGDVSRFLQAFDEKTRVKVSGADFSAMNILAMSACYSPRPDEPGRFDLPITWPSGRVRPEIWERWLEFDPVRQLERGADPRPLHAIHIECGTRDEYRLLPGARVVAGLIRNKFPQLSYAEFPDGHMGLDYRYDTVLPWMAARLAEI